MKGFKNITVRENLTKILKIEARRLGFGSIGDYIEVLNNVRLKMAWSGLDLQILAQYGKLPDITLTTEQELRERGFKKIADSEGKPSSETLPKIQVEVRAKKKPTKLKKINESKAFDDAQTRTPEMPKSSEFFKEKS